MSTTDARPGGSRPDRPVILAVDDDPHVLRAVRRELRGRYGDRYRVLAAGGGEEALAALRELDEQDEDVALLIFDQRMPDMTGTELFAASRPLAPVARRVLLTAYADTAAAITAINDIRLDHYVVKPWEPPQERLFPVLDELLEDWAGRHREGLGGIEVVGHALSADTHRIRDFLMRNERPFRFVDVERDAHGRRVAEANPDARLPLVVLEDGAVLAAPDNVLLARRTGLAVEPSRPHYDTVIIGGGPAGLGAAVYAASEGLSALLVDADSPGGQAGTSSWIENYLGFPSGVSGADLARRALTQARRFGVEVLNPVAATALESSGRTHLVRLADGRQVSAESVLLTMGVQYNRLQVPGADRLEGAGLYYGAATTESMNCQGHEVFVVGGANSAGQAALHFARYASRVTVLVRSETIEEGMSQYLVDEIRQTPQISVRTSTEIVELHGEERLEAVTLAGRAADGTRTTEQVPSRFVFTFIGARPRTEWLTGVLQRDGRGFVRTGPEVRTATQDREGGALSPEGDDEAPDWPLATREPLLLETSLPGVFAAGDIRSGSVKRVASGVGEGALAVALLHRYRALG